MPSSRLDCPLSLKTPNMGNIGEDDPILSFGLPFEPEDSQYGECQFYFLLSFLRPLRALCGESPPGLAP